MTEPVKRRILFLAPSCDGTDVGESYCAFRWAEQVATRCDLTVLTLQRPGRVPLQSQLPSARVVSWPELRLPSRFERVNAMLKPGYVDYYRRVRGWLREHRSQFDLVHQITPMAMRYPSPAAGMDIPYVVGPVAGSLETPPAFEPECGSAPWFTRLRRLDRHRLRWDPLLKRSFEQASLILGAAPYVGETLAPLKIKRLEIMNELGVDTVVRHPERPLPPPGRLRLVHVGRAVRTKGLRDCVRALAHLEDMPGVTLDAAGGGEELEACRAEAAALGVADRIVFHGPVDRATVEALYEKADIFLFPSFREPTGGVIFEALRHGLPVVTVARGGPDHFIDESCGIKVPVRSPAQLSHDLAEAIRTLAVEPSRLRRLQDGAYRRICEIGLWSRKLDAIMALYEEVVEEHPRKTGLEA